MIPISSMEAAAAGGKSAITINISGLGVTATLPKGEDFSKGEDLDGEFSEDDNEGV
jgi:hypothetical protein